LPIFEKTNDMALILPVKGIRPKFGKNCFLTENATIVGEVEMGAIVMDHVVIETDLSWQPVQ